MNKWHRIEAMSNMLSTMSYMARDVKDLTRWADLHHRLTRVLCNYATR